MIHEIFPSSTKFYNPNFYSLTVIASNMCVTCGFYSSMTVSIGVPQKARGPKFRRDSGFWVTGLSGSSRFLGPRTFRVPELLGISHFLSPSRLLPPPPSRFLLPLDSGAPRFLAARTFWVPYFLGARAFYWSVQYNKIVKSESAGPAAYAASAIWLI